jgi:hypothetical protein
MRVAELFAFMEKRHAIYIARSNGLPKPWTDDAILQSYRFCNVYRQLDTETIWIRDNWLLPHQQFVHAWFGMLVARVVNWSPTLSALGWPVPWNRLLFVAELRQRTHFKEKVWTGAYMVTTHKKPVPKEIYYADLLDTAWLRRKKLMPQQGDTLAGYHSRLMDLDGIGSFIAGQVIADLKYSDASPLRRARDWRTWSAPGTGSIRGMNRVLNRPINYRFDPLMWQDMMSVLMAGLTARMNKSKKGIITELPHAQDIQNCLCEFDKYERVRLGEGVPRSIYNGRS